MYSSHEDPKLLGCQSCFHLWSLHICHVLIIICRKLRGCDNVTSNGRKFIPSLTNTGQLFQRLKWGDTRTQTALWPQRRKVCQKCNERSSSLTVQSEPFCKSWMSYHHYIFLVLSKGGDLSEDHIFPAEAKISQPTALGMSQISSAGVVTRVQVGQPRDWDLIPCRGKKLALGTIQPQFPMSCPNVCSWSLLHLVPRLSIHGATPLFPTMPSRCGA